VVIASSLLVAARIPIRTPASLRRTTSGAATGRSMPALRSLMAALRCGPLRPALAMGTSGGGVADGASRTNTYLSAVF
jgi:hypothetical protein